MSGKMESRPLLRSSRPSGYSSLSSIDETNPHPPLVEATKPVDKILKANEQTGMIPFPDEEEDLVLCISEVESGRVCRPRHPVILALPFMSLLPPIC